MTINDELLAEMESIDAMNAITSALAPFSAFAQERALIHILAKLRYRTPVPKPVTDVPPTRVATSTTHDVRPYTDRCAIMNILLEQPRRPITNIALDVYGSGDEKAQSKVRSHLNQLRLRGLAVAVASGKWEAVTTTPSH